MKLLTKARQKRLIQSAQKARAHAYSPYSGYQVGAAILSDDGTIHMGCNIENVSYGATTCAEQVAIFSARAAGKKKFLAIAVVASDKKRPIPCGICRQVLWELAGDIEIILIQGSDFELFPLSQIYPQPYEKQK